LGGRMGPMKRCPECAEDVRADAFRCRHCQVEFGSPDDGEVINGWIRSHPTIAASLATFLYVAFQIFKAGDFEVNTTVELLRAGGLTSILLGVLLVQLPIELVLLNLAVCWWLLSMPAGRGRTSAGRPTGSHRPALAAIGGLLVLSFYVTPWPFFTLSAVLSAAAVHVSTRWLGHARVVRSARVAMLFHAARRMLARQKPSGDHPVAVGERAVHQDLSGARPWKSNRPVSARCAGSTLRSAVKIASVRPGCSSSQALSMRLMARSRSGACTITLESSES